MTYFPFAETVTRVRPAVRDRHGDPTGPATEVDIPGAAIWPLGSAGQFSSDESLNRADTITTGTAIFLPPGSDVLPTDRFRVRGVLHDVNGEPSDYRSPLTGTRPGIYIVLKRYEG